MLPGLMTAEIVKGVRWWCKKQDIYVLVFLIFLFFLADPLLQEHHLSEKNLIKAAKANVDVYMFLIVRT